MATILPSLMPMSPFTMPSTGSMMVALQISMSSAPCGAVVARFQTHAVAQRLAAAVQTLVAGHGIVVLDLGEERGVAEPHCVAFGGAVQLRRIPYGSSWPCVYCVLSASIDARGPRAELELTPHPSPLMVEDRYPLAGRRCSHAPLKPRAFAFFRAAALLFSPFVVPSVRLFRPKISPVPPNSVSVTSFA